ncbi:hypothetical protein BRE01_48940 [Brevibacillus reuszeri]|uniref:Uncharacterized protein n=1 Tax=Brevibacillus reuszeri TaxID=54915 RepID=A0ABQ0TTH8_9BACL|nr:hypothetical protein BRE01_48940 [Brevibacillus reuszeri]
MGMTLVKITMPTTQDGDLVHWEACIQAYREKEKRKWQRKLEGYPVQRIRKK